MTALLTSITRHMQVSTIAAWSAHSRMQEDVRKKRAAILPVFWVLRLRRVLLCLWCVLPTVAVECRSVSQRLTCC
ncbi:hypothetical protein BC831DRAFT_457015 [Entophlyctis helioformis]|nr:hypothetical protein BC831DRAFT_457015 [Entophlyctis helioformis]